MVLHNRKRNRLKGYDYSLSGYYFVTICVKDRKKYFGKIINRKMYTNKIGEVIEKYWEEIPRYYVNCLVDEHIIMPNHIHGILVVKNVGTEQCSVPTKYGTLSKIIKSFKDVSTKTIRNKYIHDFTWQRSFYDHIVRSEKSLYAIRNYIKYNPYKWEEDEYMVM